jgi:hypothetical protein
MPFPSQTFNNLDDWKTWIDSNIIPNGNQEIIGDDGNITENAAVKFIKQSPLNWEEASVVNTALAVIAPRPVVVFTGSTPVSLTWNDNIYNEYVFINMTSSDIPLLGLLVYYKPDGTTSSVIPATTAVNIFKAENDLWVEGSNSGSGGGGSTQKQPLTFVVGTTLNAPTAGTTTWQLPAFANSWVMLTVNRIPVDLIDTGDGSAFITKTLVSDTLTIGNYGSGWNTGDVLTYTLITP